MWPFKRRRPRVYLINIYSGGREERRICPVTDHGDGKLLIHRFDGDSNVYVLEGGGKITGQTDLRWEALDELPGLTDGQVCPHDTISHLEDRIQDLRDHLERVIESAEVLRDAKAGASLRKAESGLTSAIGRAENAMDRE